MSTFNTLILMAFISVEAMASATDASRSQITDESVRPGLQLVFEPSSALKSTSDPTYSAGADIGVIPSLKLSRDWTVASLWTVTQNWTGERSTRLVRSELRATWAGRSFASGLNYGAYGSVFLPLRWEARSNESLIVGLRVAPKIGLDLSAVSRVPVQLEYEIAPTRSFHEYTTSVRGESNSRYSILQRGLLSLNLGRGWGLSSQLAYYSFFSYEGEVTNKFKWDQEVGFVPHPQWGFALGVSNFAAGQKPNGQDSNLGLFDYETTVIYGSLSYSI